MTTTHLGMTLPVVGADDDGWGTLLNTALTVIDTMFGAPTFSAYKGSSQTIGVAATKVQFPTEEWDTGSCYDAVTNFRFTPTVGGYYQIKSGVNFFASSGILYLYKNGSEYKRGLQYGGLTAADVGAVGSWIVLLNGSTDYVEIYAASPGGAVGTNAGQALVYFQGALIRPT